MVMPVHARSEQRRAGKVNEIAGIYTDVQYHNGWPFSSDVFWAGGRIRLDPCDELVSIYLQAKQPLPTLPGYGEGAGSFI
jgi:hypothetical protein